MPDRLFSTEYWKVRTEAPGVAEPILEHQYKEAVREFFHRSRAWRYETPVLALDANAQWPTLTLPANTYVVEPIAVTWVPTGSNVPFRPRDWLDTYRPGWQAEKASAPNWWTKYNAGEYSVVPKLQVTVAEAARLRLALSITQAATGLPDDLFYEFANAFAAGALMNVLKMPGKDWSDPEMAAVYAASFEQQIVAAKARADSDYARPTRTVRYGGI